MENEPIGGLENTEGTLDGDELSGSIARWANAFGDLFDEDGSPRSATRPLPRPLVDSDSGGPEPGQSPRATVGEHDDTTSSPRQHSAVLDSPESAEKLDRELDSYAIIRMIGRGGMGLVYLAEDSHLNREVAFKIARSREARLRDRFVEEAQVLAQLEHPNIVPLHELGTADGRIFCTQRYVRGHTLSAVLRALIDGDADTARTYTRTYLIQIMIQMTRALAYAHAKGVVHRDLKPSNVMLGEHGEVQVLDWGLALVTPDAKVRTSSSTAAPEGHVVGTPHYMASEQALGNTVDARADIYSLGVILYELLTYGRPFEGDHGDRRVAESDQDGA